MYLPQQYQLLNEGRERDRERFCFLSEVSLSPGQAGVVSGEFEVIFLHPNVEVVVLPSPSPELVGEPVHLSELGHRYR